MKSKDKKISENAIDREYNSKKLDKTRWLCAEDSEKCNDRKNIKSMDN